MIKVQTYYFYFILGIWGFYAHQRINRLAVFTLPSEMLMLYKQNIEYLTENAVKPDQRRYAVKDEAPKHYIDLDVYPDSVKKDLKNLSWEKAVEKYTEDTLMAYGIVPWQLIRIKGQLTSAFRRGDLRAILSLSADAGHYMADAHVPLHTTENYNGQMTNQIGIHGFWESRLPELYAEEYEFWVGKATYISNMQGAVWEVVGQSHAALDSVLMFERELSNKMPDDKKYTVEERNGQTVKAYSKEFSSKYHQMLNDQVQRRMRSSVKMVGNLWYTAWVDAGQPDLSKLGHYEKTQEDLNNEEDLKKQWLQRILRVRTEGD